MRVITGSARGRRLKQLEGLETRPTTGRVKEAVFSILQFDIEGRRVLDLFAGTGQLGIEALSRGAAYAAFVEKRRDAANLIRENLKLTELIQNTSRIAFYSGADGSLHVIGKDRRSALNHISDVVVVDLDIVKGTDPANNSISHRDSAHLQAAAKLHIRLNTSQQQYVGSKPTNIHNEGTGVLLNNLGLRNHGSVGLGINQHLSDH